RLGTIASGVVRSSTGLGFFFSSRRRHTRWPRDWSSDVCSSDLPRTLPGALDPYWIEGAREGARRSPPVALGTPTLGRVFVRKEEIGRASRREREETASATVAVPSRSSLHGTFFASRVLRNLVD